MEKGSAVYLFCIEPIKSYNHEIYEIWSRQSDEEGP